VEAAERLLDGIADLEDPQIGLRLLRRAAGHSRLAHNLRCAAPGPQGRALRHFDDLVRTCFDTLTGLHPDAAQWEQATRGLGHGGLGLRSTVRDSAAAYLASVGGCSVACTQLDPHYSAIADSHAASALSTYNQVLGTASPLTLETAFSLRQKALTLKLDIASWERQLASSTVAGRAVLLSEAEPGARAFLAALPSGRTRIEPALFTTELGQRLGMTEALQDGWCPQCDSVLDRFSYHAAVCVAGGERVQRHNALRDLLHWWLDVAGLKPEKEKPGLLLPHRPDDSVAERRPADIFLPTYAGSPTALDLAVTAPLRAESLTEASNTPAAAAASYAQVKRTHLDTAAVCARQGLSFKPLVLECTGAWEREAAKFLRHVSGSVAVRTGQDVSQVHGKLLQELCVVARCHRARAVLRRRAGLASASAADFLVQPEP
jgi:hypothetical protein